MTMNGAVIQYWLVLLLVAKRGVNEDGWNHSK